MSISLIHVVSRALLFQALVSAVCGLRVLSPQQLAATIESPIMNVRVGLQAETTLSALEGNLQRVEFGTACSLDSNNAQHARTAQPIVYVLDVPLVDIPGEVLREILCLQDNPHTSAVVVVGRDYPSPGLALFDSRLFPSDPSQIHIHVLHAASSKEMAAVMTYLTNGSPNGPVHVQLEISSNPWQDDFWNTTAFFVIFQVILTGMNLAIAAFALFRVVKQASALFASGFESNFLTLAFVANFVELFSCLCRAVYFWIGPLHSSTRLTFVADEFLGTITFGTGNLVTYLSVAYVSNLIWTITETNKSRWSWVAGIAVLIGFASLLLNITAIFADQLSLAELQALIGIVLTLTASLAFLASGNQLLKILVKSHSDAALSREKTIAWIRAASVAQLFQVGALLAGVLITDGFRTPQTYLWVAAVAFFGLTIASGAHCVALNPSKSVKDGANTTPFQALGH